MVQVLAKASNDNFDVEWVNQSGGGGGGSTVTITPTLATGTKIADYSIDGVNGELYAPNNGGGGGGTTNYNDLSNKPTINNVTLIGNKSFSDLGLSTATTSTNGLMSSSVFFASPFCIKLQNKM